MLLGHASRERLLALAEAGPGPIDDAHVAGCERCRREVAALRGTLQEMRAAEVPEPSPLFWEHMSRRIRSVTTEAPEPVRSQPWRRAGAWAPAWGTLALLLLVIAWRVGYEANPRPVPGGAPVATVEPTWEMVWELASTLSDEDVRLVVGAPPEDTVHNLTATERDAFVRLLDADLRAVR